jgi:hypothetical protein
MKPQEFLNNTENDIKTFRRIRKAIGYLGISLPILLVLLSQVPFFKTPLQPSISDYYYTNLREIFTGILCAVGLFLIRYKGTKNSSFWKNDSLLTNIAGYMAFGVAFFPTNPESWDAKIYTLIPLKLSFLGTIHYGFAAIFFFILGMISINVFTIGQRKETNLSKSAFDENNIYRICGYLILVFIIIIPFFSFLKIFNYSTILFEAFALASFGISWLIKGRFLGDKGKVGMKVYREFN